MKKINARLPEELLEKLDKEAKRFGIKRSEYLRLILISWFLEDGNDRR